MRRSLKDEDWVSPVGGDAIEAARRRRAKSPEYRAEYERLTGRADLGIVMGSGETPEDYAQVHAHSRPRYELPKHVVGETVIHEHPFGPGHADEPPHPLPGCEDLDE